MRVILSSEVEAARIREGHMGTDATYGCCGAFMFKRDGGYLQAIVSDGLGWDHVSVSPPGQDRTPTWEEMAWVKALFWTKKETVIQFHPAEADYVNYHPNVLHLWKYQGGEFPLPDPMMVGPKK